MPGNTSFAKNLANERRKRGMTVKDFANLLDVSSSTLFSWENGVTPRDLAQLKYISEKLKLPLYFLIFGEAEAGQSIVYHSTH